MRLRKLLKMACNAALIVIGGALGSLLMRADLIFAQTVPTKPTKESKQTHVESMADARFDPSKGVVKELEELKQKVFRLEDIGRKQQSELEKLSQHSIVKCGTVTKRLNAENSSSEGIFFNWSIRFDDKIDLNTGNFSVFVNARKGHPLQHCWAEFTPDGLGLEVTFLDSKNNAFPELDVTLDYVVVQVHRM